jgi:hypothetical protein
MWMVRRLLNKIISKCAKPDIINQIQKSNSRSKKAKTEEALLDLFGDGSLRSSLIENVKFQRLFDINDRALPLKREGHTPKNT